MKHWLGLHAHMCIGIWVREIFFLAYVIPAYWVVKHSTNYTELKVYNNQTGYFFHPHLE